MVCLIDMCKAAAYLPVSFEQTALRTLAPELADDLRVGPNLSCPSHLRILIHPNRRIGSSILLPR